MKSGNVQFTLLIYTTLSTFIEVISRASVAAKLCVLVVRHWPLTATYSGG